MLTEMQKKVLLATADKIEKDPEHYNQGCWVRANVKNKTYANPKDRKVREWTSFYDTQGFEQTSLLEDLKKGYSVCNTTCCVAGWILINRLTLDKEYTSEFVSIEWEAGRVSGLSERLRTAIFDVSFCPTKSEYYSTEQEEMKDHKERAKRVAELIRGIANSESELEAVRQWFNQYKDTMNSETRMDIGHYIDTSRI